MRLRVASTPARSSTLRLREWGRCCCVFRFRCRRHWRARRLPRPRPVPADGDPMTDYAYLMKGLTRVATSSSTLVSSSKYLNDPRIRDWVATHLLRKNGPDAPTPSDPMPLVLALREVQDIEHINALFVAERRKNPALDAWF